MLQLAVNFELQITKHRVATFISNLYICIEIIVTLIEIDQMCQYGNALADTRGRHFFTANTTSMM